MSENEEKGFVFKDRRKIFSETEKEPEQKKSTVSGGTFQEKETEEAPPIPPLPEVNFSTFIVSLSTEVLFHLGNSPIRFPERKKRIFPWPNMPLIPWPC